MATKKKPDVLDEGIPPSDTSTESGTTVSVALPEVSTFLRHSSGEVIAISGNKNAVEQAEVGLRANGYCG